MRYALDELADSLRSEGGLIVQNVYASSGKLTAQILSGAPYDCFFSASDTFSSRVKLNHPTASHDNLQWKGELMLWTQNSSWSNAIEALAAANRIAIANPYLAPYGLAAVEALKSLQLWDTVKDQIVYGENIGQVNQFLVSGAADVALTSGSISRATRLAGNGQQMKIESHHHSPIIHELILLGANQNAEQTLRDYLQSQPGITLMRKHGFEPI